MKKRKEEERLQQREAWRIERETNKKQTSLESLVASAETRGAIHTVINDSQVAGATEEVRIFIHLIN